MTICQGRCILIFERITLSNSSQGNIVKQLVRMQDTMEKILDELILINRGKPREDIVSIDNRSHKSGNKNYNNDSTRK
ncbi:hypothetical protein FDI69_gp187 [Rhodococcus phage Trina]|uniref:Uncharacterized protein n=1 Tax=Rhodococcus phage Trina TaxID=2027905 RepID=A0A2D0ZN48_9CAUD|nr:hypothetical protein FDI69_gp187 [Rhodococcus phage Trina]ASZ74999.1 hypothetical protein SEA_TRINA_220 [Rhodococcus phage Trina]